MMSNTTMNTCKLWYSDSRVKLVAAVIPDDQYCFHSMSRMPCAESYQEWNAPCPIKDRTFQGGDVSTVVQQTLKSPVHVKRCIKRKNVTGHVAGG